MPDFSQAAADIASEFNTQFSALSPTYDIAWENVDFTPADGEPWVRLTINEGEAFIGAIGGGKNTYRHPGTVIVQVFTPTNIGYGKARSIADDVASIFRGKRISGVRFLSAPYINRVGPDGDWYQLNVICPFEYDLNI